MKSKRSSYRFEGFLLPVQYRTAFEEGEAVLVTVSTSGCSLKAMTSELPVGEDVLVAFEIDDHEFPIEVKVRVVRESDGVIGAEFTMVDSEAKLAIRNYFSKRRRKVVSRAGNNSKK